MIQFNIALIFVMVFVCNMAINVSHSVPQESQHPSLSCEQQIEIGGSQDFLTYYKYREDIHVNNNELSPAGNDPDSERAVRLLLYVLYDPNVTFDYSNDDTCDKLNIIQSFTNYIRCFRPVKVSSRIMSSEWFDNQNEGIANVIIECRNKRKFPEYQKLFRNKDEQQSIDEFYKTYGVKNDPEQTIREPRPMDTLDVTCEHQINSDDSEARKNRFEWGTQHFKMTINVDLSDKTTPESERAYRLLTFFKSAPKWREAYCNKDGMTNIVNYVKCFRPVDNFSHIELPTEYFEKYNKDISSEIGKCHGLFDELKEKVNDASAQKSIEQFLKTYNPKN